MSKAHAERSFALEDADAFSPAFDSGVEPSKSQAPKAASNSKGPQACPGGAGCTGVELSSGSKNSTNLMDARAWTPSLRSGRRSGPTACSPVERAASAWQRVLLHLVAADTSPWRLASPFLMFTPRTHFNDIYFCDCTGRNFENEKVYRQEFSYADLLRGLHSVNHGLREISRTLGRSFAYFFTSYVRIADMLRIKHPDKKGKVDPAWKEHAK